MSSDKIIAIVPMRSGSSLTDKNIRSLHGMPLFYWTIKKLLILKDEGLIDTIILSTDSTVYANLAFQYFSHNIVTDIRPKALGTCDASTESVVIDYLKRIFVTKGTLLISEVTSPLIPVSCFKEVLAFLKEDGVSSSFAVASDYSNWWTGDKATSLKKKLFPLYTKREMRQNNTEPLYREVGLWGVDIKQFLKEKNRIVDPHQNVVIDSNFGISIDTEKDFILAEWLMKLKHRRVFDEG